MRLIALLGMGFSLSYRWLDVWHFMDCLYVSPLPAPSQCGGRRAVYALHIGANIYRIMKEEYGSTMRHFAALQRVRIRCARIDRWYQQNPRKYLRTLKCGSTSELLYCNQKKHVGYMLIAPETRDVSVRTEDHHKSVRTLDWNPDASQEGSLRGSLTFMPSFIF